MNQISPRIGIGAILIRQGLVLLGLRKGSHGSGTWALPGGHLEFGESVEDCAIREIREETGLRVQRLSAGPYSNDLFEDKHYVTLFVVAHSESGEPRIVEPEKCSRWAWFPWSRLPTPLFRPLASIQSAGYVPPGVA